MLRKINAYMQLSRLNLKPLLVSVLCLMSAWLVQLHAQEWNTARLSVLYGNNVPFNFSNLARIKEGININVGTRFGITITNLAVPGHDNISGFVLYFRAFNNQTHLKSAVAQLPLDVVKVKADNFLGLESGSSYGYVPLATDWTPLFIYDNPLMWTNLNWANHQLTVSYTCGVPDALGNGGLMGEIPDFYNVEIEFELVPLFNGI